MNENLNDYATSAQDEPQKETVVQEPEVKEPEVQEEVSSAVKTKKSKKVSSTKIVILSVIAIILISIITVFGIVFSDIKGKNLKKPVDFEIKKGSSSLAIAHSLKDNDVIKFPIVFRVYARIKGFDNQFKYGHYTFEGKNSYFDICQKLINEGEAAKSVTVTIPEGTSILDYTKDVNGNKVTVPGIATILENAGVCTKEDFLIALNQVALDSKLLQGVNKEKAYMALEGYLFPDTYDFYNHDSKECALLAVKKMLAQAENKITEDMYNRADELGLSMNEVLTLASIIQLESGQNTSEMPNVAAVFYNRLKSRIPLYSSPTCYYGYAFKYDDGRYDTYKIIGLPPGPVSAPGVDAIKAVLWPTQNSPYYYFVTDKNGKFYYNKTLAAHNHTIAKLRNEGNFINEYLD